MFFRLRIRRLQIRLLSGAPRSREAHMTSAGVHLNPNRNLNRNPIFRSALRMSPALHEHDQAMCF